MIYLDSAATSLIKPKSVSTAMLNAMQTMASPGRGTHIAAMRAADNIYKCRELACGLFNYDKPERIVFYYECKPCSQHCHTLNREKW